MNLKETLTQIALKWGYRMHENKPGSYSVEVVLVRNKVDTRYQYVTVQHEQFEGKPPRIYIQGYCGLIDNRFTEWELLKLAIGYNFCTIARLDTKDPEGNPLSELIVQSAPLEEYMTQDFLDAIIFEVADKTDYIKMKYYETSGVKNN